MNIERGKDISIKNKVDTKEIKLIPKNDTPIYLNFCSDNDYVKVPTHNSFNDKIYPNTCLKVNNNGECPFCKAYTSNIKAMRPTDFFVFAFITDGKTMFLQVSYNQGVKIMNQIAKYSKHISAFIPFTLTKTGSKQTTTYDIVPISEFDMDLLDDKIKKEIAKNKEIAQKTTISDDFFRDICQPVDYAFANKLVYEAYNIGEKPITEENSNEQDIVPKNEDESEKAVRGF